MVEINMNIDGNDIAMRTAICFGKEYDKWLVSRCGKVWSLYRHRILPGGKKWTKKGEDGKRNLLHLNLTISLSEEDWWGDGSSRPSYKTTHGRGTTFNRDISVHKMIIDTWAPLYDNPPEGIVWEEWEIVRDLPSVYNHISKTICIDHIDNNPANNHLDNLRRVTSWDNNHIRKARGI